MKRSLCALLLLCTACTPSPKQNVLRLNITDDPVSLDPRDARSLRDLSLMKQLYEGLTRLNVEGIPELALAKDYTLSDDGCTYHFTLRDASWSDGSPVTAEEFVTSWEEAKQSSIYAHMLAPVATVAGSGTTLDITLKSPTPYFLELTAFPTYFPVHEGAFSGPFTLTKWEPGARVELSKNPTYWDASSVSLDGIHLSIIQDNLTENLLFEQGEIDWLGQPMSDNIQTELVGKYKEAGMLHSYDVAGTLWLTFNTDRIPQTLRRALSLAINRRALIDHLLQGNQSVATGVLPPSMALSVLPYFQDGDRQTAKTLLQDLPKTLTLHYPPTERNKKIAQYLQREWEEALGLTVAIEAVETQVYRRRLKEGDYTIGIGQWIGDFNDPIAFLELFQGQDVGLNESRWSDPRYQALIDQSRTELNPNTRKDLLSQAEKILIESMPVAPLYHYAFDYVKRDTTQGVVLSPLGIADFKWAQNL